MATRIQRITSHLTATVGDCHSGVNVVADVHSDTCTTCHSGTPATRDNEMLGAAANGIDGDATQADGTAAGATWGTVTCTTCHNPATYTWEAIHTDTATAVDHSTAVAATTDSTCETCHSGTGSNMQIALNSGVTRAADLLHDNCSTCHTANGALDISKNSTGYVLGTMAAGNCHQCHTDTYFDSHVHGTDSGYISHVVTYAAGTDISQVSNPAPCYNCHDQFNLATWSGILSEHVTGCARCHSYTEPGGETPPTPSEAENYGAMGSRTAATCTTCHQQKLSPDPDSDHGGHSSSAFGWTTGTQASCGTAGCHDWSANPDVVQDIHGGTCSLCHTSSGSRDGGRNGANGNSTLAAGGNLDDACTVCHTSGEFHGLAASDVSTRHNNLGDSTGEAATYTGKLSGAYGGLKVTTYNCADCHSTDRVAITPLDALNAHLAKGSCQTCHNAIADFEARITAGRAVVDGGSDQVQTCELCHNATINGGGSTNGPSGEAMYQYDGVRHHKTAHAQAGDCTWCHADPRPAIPTQFTGYAATADSSGTYDTGWLTDYSAPSPSVIPKQIGCRLCHTNYETFSVAVNADQNGNTNYGETVDLHGYNIDGQAVGYSTSGLTVYANDYDNMTLNNSYPSGATNPGVRGPSQVAQTSIHRIDHNDGTSKINVYDYGACLGCHTVQLYHAAPIAGSDYTGGSTNNDSLPFDTLRYAPGRHIFNLLRGPSNTTQDWDDHRLPAEFNNRTWNGDRGDSLMAGTYNKNPSDAQVYYDTYPSFTLVPVPAIASVNNYEALGGITNGQLYSAKGGIIRFADISAPAIPDDVQVQSVVWDGATVTVVATNDDGCAALSARTQPDGVVRISAGGFTGTGTCTGTFALGSISGVTVDVETTNAAGTDSTGNAIDDQSCTPITVSISGYADLDADGDRHRHPGNECNHLCLGDRC